METINPQDFAALIAKEFQVAVQTVLQNTRALPADYAGDDRFMTVAEVAQMAGCGVSTVWRDVKRGTFPEPVKTPSGTRWRLSDVRKWMQNPMEWEAHK